MSTYIGLGSLVLAALGALGAHLRALPPLVGFGLFVLGALGGAVATVIGLVGFARQRDPGLLAGVAIGLPVFLALAVPAIRGRKHPRINDISTNLNDPPGFVAAGDIPYPPGFIPIVREHYSDLVPARIPANADQVFQRAVTLAQDRDWTITRIDETARELEAVATTQLFRFEDDIVVRVRPAESGGARVDLRSRSRDGKGDFGVNAERIRAFVAAIEAEAGGR